MNDEMKARLTSGDVWMRALYMIFFAIAYSVAELLIALTVIFQFLNILFTGNANIPLLRFGRNLSEYVFQIIQFETFNTEERPFPFTDWPDEEPGGEQWQGAEPAETQAPETTPEEGGFEERTEDVADDVSESRRDATPPPA